MNLISAVLALVLALPSLSIAAGSPVDTRKFVESIQGTYQIDLAGGQKPHEENSQADVTADTTEGIFTMPFCGSNGLCDPGYIDFGYPATQVLREDLGINHYLFTLNTVVSGKTQRYTWEFNAGVVTFTNYQYRIGSQVTQLQHVLRKIAP